jgi:L-amino acid N-acyltransferase YncA
VSEIRKLVAADYPEVARIYQEGLDVGTFEETVPDWGEWDAGHLPMPRLVAVDDDIIAWAAASQVSSRACYRGVVEHSIYVARAARGRGVGLELLTEFLRRTDELGLWTVQAGILAGNDASIALHAACGFRVVGTRERLAQKRGTWRDVVLMERRAPLS